MPKAVRSSHHIRGLPDQEAFKLIDTEARVQTERKRMVAAAPPPQDETYAAARAAVLPFGEPSSTPLEELARPKARGGALAFLQVLVRQFPYDVVLKKMLKQVLEGRLPWRGLSSMDYEIYDIFHESRTRGRLVDPRSDPSRAPSVRERIRQLDADEEKLRNDLQVWLISDADRARQTLESLKAAQQVTQKIDSLLLRAATRWISRGASTSLGPVFTSTRNHPSDLRGVMLIEDLFAQACRAVGTWEVVARFGRHYLPTQRLSNALRPAGFLELDVPTGGGPTIDCATQRASCEASSCAAGCTADCAVDGNPRTGWRPDYTQLYGGGMWLRADLGRLHSCVGVQLCWGVARCKEAIYVDQPSLNQDFELQHTSTWQSTERGMQMRLVVTSVTPQGIAESTGVIPGDYLLLDPGVPPEMALSGLTFPARLNFQSADADAPTGRFNDPAAVTQIKARLSTSKSPAATAWEVLKPSPASEEDLFPIQVSADSTADLPVVFVGRWIKLEFMTDWPRTTGGLPFQLSIRVVKVWRLAPPSFKLRFFDALRRRARGGNPLGSADKSVKKLARPALPFWAGTAHKGTFNRKVKHVLEYSRRLHHDGEVTQDELLADLQDDDGAAGLEPTPWVFHSLRSAHGRGLRAQLHSKDDDARECTFHPRAAGHVPQHVMRMRGRGLRDLVSAAQGVGNFVNGLGEDMNSQRYPNYYLIHRQRTLQVARRHYHRGYMLAAWRKLKEEFGVEHILDRYRCFHPGCGRALSTDSEICRCSGYYCPSHQDPAVHNCAQMKQMLAKRAQEAKKLPVEDRPKEEKFDNKKELGLLFEVFELASKIRSIQEAKEKQRGSLMKLGTALKSMGAIRMLERPFKRSMCKVALEGRQHTQHQLGKKVPTLGPNNVKKHKEDCHCPKAHSPAELRFPAGESVSRRTAWVAASVNRLKTFEDVMSATRNPSTEAERKVVEKERGLKKTGAKSKSRPRRSSRPASYRTHRRARSETRIAGLDGWHPPLPEPSRREVLALTEVAHDRNQPDVGAAPRWARADTADSKPPSRLEDLQRSCSALESKVGQVVQTCSDMELELMRQHRDQQEDEECRQQLLAKQRLESALPQTGAHHSAHRRGLREMCENMLDKGECMLGDLCPYAHHPSELASRT